mgnify:CR=1 FL=1
MPAKKTVPKQRAENPNIPLEAWATKFAFGHDYFNDLGRYGIKDSDRDAVERAWAYYGKTFLDHWHVIRETFFPGENAADDPWALTTFGNPRK